MRRGRRGDGLHPPPPLPALGDGGAPRRGAAARGRGHGAAGLLRRGRRRRQPARRRARRAGGAGRRPPGAGRATSATRRRSSSTTPATGRIRIFTPEVELPFAGHPVRRHRLAAAPRGLRGRRAAPAGRGGPVRHDGELTWVAGRGPSGARRSSSGSSRRRPRSTPTGAAEGGVYIWAWIDEDAGTIRARCFVPEAGIAEDEATGSAALRLCAAARPQIEVRQGERLGDPAPGRSATAWSRSAAGRSRTEGPGQSTALISAPGEDSNSRHTD